jgi:hypothetical protein
LDLKSATMASGNIADEVISIGNCTWQRLQRFMIGKV